MSLGDILLQLLAGWLLADLLSGFFHWLEDRVLWEGMPLLGRLVVAPNRLHHADPMAFTRSGFAARNSTTWALTVPIAAAWIWLAGFSFVWLGALAGALAVTEVHVRTHRPVPRASGWRLLQEIGLVQSVRQHSSHHAGAMDRAYCVLTDWLNPILDRLRVWERLERALAAIGLEPNASKETGGTK